MSDQSQNGNPAAPVAIAILIPCFNEEQTIASVIRRFRDELPGAAVYVCDNDSSDRTAQQARAAGAIVLREPRRGKGYAVQSLFRRVDAAAYVMVDGDDTYSAAEVHRLLQPILDGEADMVVGSRLHGKSRSRFRAVNRLGNQFFRTLLNSVFRVRLTDILSGYRAFDRAFVKSLPLFGGGFEIETELTIKALEQGYRVVEVPVSLDPRPAGSHSKIRVVQDGLLILNTILTLLRDYKPLTFFGLSGVAVAALGLALTAPGAATTLPRSGMLGPVFVLAGLLLIVVGLVLHTIVRRFQELRHQLQVVTDQLDPSPPRAERPDPEGR